MRAAEALLLGSLQIKPVHGIFHINDELGCAMGMIEVANGWSQKNRMVSWMNLYPWMMFVSSPMPCSCGDDTIHQLRIVGDIVFHIFDHHITGKLDKWTIEQLADWIESKDPTPKEVKIEPEVVHESSGSLAVR